MEFLLAYGAGLLTLINPCILPVLPIVLASAAQGSRLGPLALAGGLCASFVVLGIGVATLGRSVGLTEDVVGDAAAVMMIVFGLVLMVPRLSEGFATATAGFASGADARLDEVDRSGLSGQALGGALLGAVWSPCVGPTLGAAISLASQGTSLVFAGAIMLFFAFGVATVVVLLAYGARSALARRRAWMNAVATRGRPIMGALFAAVGVALLFNVHHVAEAWALDHMPVWLQDLSVSL
ncbi:MAG: cytochrome c biogenesis CcdA family protein [Pseudomonadota bacterium]